MAWQAMQPLFVARSRLASAGRAAKAIASAERIAVRFIGGSWDCSRERRDSVESGRNAQSPGRADRALARRTAKGKAHEAEDERAAGEDDRAAGEASGGHGLAE